MRSSEEIVMRKTLSVIAIVLLAFPAIGQDDFGGGGFGGGFEGVLTGGDIDALLGGGNRGNRGNNNNNNPLANPEGLFLQMRDLLKAQKVPLSKDQEKTLRTFLDTETLAMRTDLETQMGNRGNRGNSNNTQNLITDLFTIVGKNNTDLLTAMKADLTSDQVSLITKAEKDKKVCSVMLDMFNPTMMQNRTNENRGRGNQNQNQNQNLSNLPFGIEGLDFGGGQQQGNRGNQNNSWMQQMPDRAFCTTVASTPAERLAPISQILSKGKKPLTADQEKKFVGLIEAKVPAMQQEMREKDPNIQQLINSINNNNNNNQQNRGNNNNNNANNNPPAVNPATLRNNIVNTVMTQLGIPTNNNNNNNNNNRGGRGNQNQNNQNNTAAANTAAANAAPANTAAANTTPANTA